MSIYSLKWEKDYKFVEEYRFEIWPALREKKQKIDIYATIAFS